MKSKKTVKATAICCALAMSMATVGICACSNNTPELKAEYSINYNLNYQDGPTRTVNVQAGRKAVDWNTTRAGYDFLGWYIDPECKIEYNFNSRIKSDVTLYAAWEKQADKAQVTFDGNYLGKSTDTVIAISKGKKINEAQAPKIEKIGFELEGWYKDKQCTQKWNFENDTVQDDTHLYANFVYDDSVYRDEEGKPVFENVQLNFWIRYRYHNMTANFQEIIDDFNREYSGQISVTASESLPTQDLYSLRFQETPMKNEGSENYYSVSDLYELAGLECDYSRWYEGMAEDSFY